MTGEPDRRLVNAQEMAKLLDVPVSWVYQQTRLGSQAIPHYRMGKYIRFNPDEVMTFFREKDPDGKPIRHGVSYGHESTFPIASRTYSTRSRKTLSALPSPHSNTGVSGDSSGQEVQGDVAH